MILDMAIFLGGWAVAQILFNGFEEHEPWSKRLAKLVVMAIIFIVVDYFGGRPFFYSLLVLMSVGITILHGYWFHHKHGIHWRTAQPRDKYLRLIGEKE